MKHVTTNIRFPDDLYKRLKHLAVEKRQSLSQLVRDAVAHRYEASPAMETLGQVPPDDPWFKLIGCFSDPKDRYGSERHDDIYDDDDFTSDAARRIQREHRKKKTARVR